MLEQLKVEIATQEAHLNGLDPFSVTYEHEQKKLNDMIAQLTAMEAQEILTNQFEQLDFGNGMVLSLREVCASEEYYQLLSMWMQNYIGNQAQQHAAIVGSYKSEIESQELKIAELESNLSELEFIQPSAASLQLVIDDLEAKRNAASQQLSESKQEVERLTKDNESLRQQLETKSTPAAPQIDPAELFRRVQAAKPGIYNKRWEDENNRKTYLATLSETGEEIRIPWLEIGKYREETAEDAARFRQEVEERAAREALEKAAESAEAPPVSDFREQDAEVQEHTTDGTVDDAPVTRSEFEALTRKVEKLSFATGFGHLLQDGAA